MTVHLKRKTWNYRSSCSGYACFITWNGRT